MFDTRRSGSSALVAFVGAALAMLSPVSTALAQEPAACLSSDPAVWPKPSRPYFMMAMDTSGLMVANVTGAASSCGFGTTRVAHSRCAFKNTVLAYGGEVNFGLATFDVIQQGCVGACGCTPADAYCFLNCNYFCYQSELDTRGVCAGCGPKPGNAATASGALLQVPMLQDHFWLNPPAASNVPALLAWADASCAGDTRLFAIGNTPLNGMLRDMKRYFAGTYVTADGLTTYPTPLASQDLLGNGVNGGTGCRSVNVILVTDGDETCDLQSDAVAAAQDLYTNGVTVGGKLFKIRVHVINFAGGNQVNTDQIASAGGTGTSYFAQNEVQLAQALSAIIASSVSPETCDNKDNNCNGCTDEGYAHYCDQNQTCCAWINAAQRTTCLNTYAATITPGNPNGDLTKLPCTTVAQQAQPANWLCFNPGESCDNVDNNCNGNVDEGITKCGAPLHCPQAETCNGQDDDCNGVIDNGVCSGCIPTTEVCDGCDNDCDGLIDEGIASVPCGQASPPNCAGTVACPQKANPGGTPGACVAGNPFGTCSNSPQSEVCDGLDNNCNGIPDDGVAPAQCVPAGTPGNLVYGGTSQCVKGLQACGSNQCVGFIGPSAEVCDGIDNNCDGLVDNNAFGVGQSCGTNTGECTAGVTACVNSMLVCQGQVGPQPEACDGLDNDCDGQVDDPPFGNPPPAGCWNNPGNCCTFANLAWCPPAGATCSGNGALVSPCNKGTLTCAGAAGWVCSGPVGPGAEVCDGVDNNCDGAVDNVAPTQCVPAGTPMGLVYGGTSQCKMGTKTCGACNGFVGPSPELCDGVDNDCDGTVDDGAFGVGQPCGVNQPPCTPGTTACVNGMLVCQGGNGPQPEICDGVDNDCDGTADDAPLSDAPGPGMNGCWNNPGNCCTFGGLAWCPPPGATCNGNGALTSPCNHGSLKCAGAGGWICDNSKGPASETCDGLDNDCDGLIDDGSLPGVGGVCGSDVGECQTGLIVCASGFLDCAGDVPPSQELCDGLDNDCDGQIDNGIPLGGVCTPPYDVNLYPGDRSSPPCQPGALQCDGAGGLECVGGIGPSPEVCDGLDNDCDGDIDETGPAPDGMDGSANPLPPPAAKIGDPCGVDLGVCKAGKYICSSGLFVCDGGQGPGPEECDCQDNDCNGVVDNGASATCTPGKECVKGSDGCQCAAPCGNGEMPCPAGQKCEEVKSSETGLSLGVYCVVDYEAICGDCAAKTVKDAQNTIQCAPAGTELPGCIKPPVCVCKGPAGCQDPCTGVTCDPGQGCAPSGAKAGTCVLDNCFNILCQGCGKVCNLGSCIDNPCKPDSCPQDQVCKPSDDFQSFTCVGSCAEVTCKSGEKCKEGACVPTCDPPCDAGQVCDDTASPPTCVQDKCDASSCPNGACCDSITGSCGNCPCEGVICPDGQSCKDDECVEGGGGTGGSGGSTQTGTSGSGGATGTGTGTGTGGHGTGGEAPKGIWGLATGGGGCECDLAAGQSSGAARFALLALAAAIAKLRRRKRRGAPTDGDEQGVPR